MKLPRHFDETSETAPRQLRDVCETPPRHGGLVGLDAAFQRMTRAWTVHQLLLSLFLSLFQVVDLDLVFLKEPLPRRPRKAETELEGWVMP